MKLVGATNWFIRWPFVIEGVTVGFFGALLAAVVVLVLEQLPGGQDQGQHALHDRPAGRGALRAGGRHPAGGGSGHRRRRLGHRAAAVPQGLATVRGLGRTADSHLPTARLQRIQAPRGLDRHSRGDGTGSRPPSRDAAHALPRLARPARAGRRRPLPPSLNDQLEDNRARAAARSGPTSRRRRRPARRPSAISPLSTRTSTDWSRRSGSPTAAHDEAAGSLAAAPGGTRRAHHRADQEAATSWLETESDLSTQQEVFNEQVGQRLQVGRARGLPGRLARAAGLALAIDGPHRPAVDHRRAGSTTSSTQIDDLKARIEEQRAGLETERARVSTIEQKQRATTKTLDAAGRQEAGRSRRTRGRAGGEGEGLGCRGEGRGRLEQARRRATRQSRGRIADQIKAAQAAANQPRQSASSGGGGGDLSRPVPGAITSGFGYRIHPIFHVRKMHTGSTCTRAWVRPSRPPKAARSSRPAGGAATASAWSSPTAADLATLYGHQSSHPGLGGRAGEAW